MTWRRTLNQQDLGSAYDCNKLYLKDTPRVNYYANDRGPWPTQRPCIMLSRVKPSLRSSRVKPNHWPSQAVSQVTVTTMNDFCIKIGSVESHFKYFINLEGHIYTTVSTKHDLLEDKGQSKRNRAEALLLISLTPYRQAKPAHMRVKWSKETPWARLDQTKQLAKSSQKIYLEISTGTHKATQPPSTHKKFHNDWTRS